MGYYFGPGGLGFGLGLGEEGCAQPVSTAERDALRDEIRGWTSPHENKHFHEGHPDLAAIYADIQGRLAGLEARPQLLRCEKEARDRAHNWIGQLWDLCRRVKSDGAHCSGFTSVGQTFQFTVYRGPTYTIRASDELVAPGRTISDVQRGSAPAPAPISSAPPGSVVVGGEVFPSSRAVTTTVVGAGGAPAASSPVQTVGGGGGVFIPPPAYRGGDGAGILGGSVAGIPTQYLVYGAIGLVAWRMLKGR